MTEVQQQYQNKLTTPEEAVKVVKSGDWLDYALTVNTPKALDEALAARAEELEDINIRGLLALHVPAVFEANDRLGKRVFTWNSWHFGGYERKAVKNGYVFYAPIRYFELPSYYRKDIERVDVLMLQVAPMDAEGYFSFGPSNSHLQAVCERAKHIIVEVNENMPRLFGIEGHQIHIDQVDAIVEANTPIDLVGSGKSTEIDQKIAKLVLSEITDGACLQLGIGGMPNAVGHMIAQSDLKDLGIHTEMYVDSMLEMTKAGKVTGKYKNLDPGKQVFTFAGGSAELYEYMKENDQFLTAPVDYVNDPKVVQQIDNFVSINNALQVDIYGQVNAESMGTRQISGTGGQLDFVTGAYHSKGGKSFIALTSTFTNKSGELESRIVPNLDLSSIVTDARTSPHYIVTEYGMANLKGKSTWQRAEELINIAHPQFRDELIRDAEEKHIWRASNKR